MMVDQRCLTLSKGRDSSHFNLWAKLSTMEKGKPIYIPLISYDYFENRGGELSKEEACMLQAEDFEPIGMEKKESRKIGF